MAAHAASLLGFEPSVHFYTELSATCLLGCTVYKQTLVEETLKEGHRSLQASMRKASFRP